MDMNPVHTPARQPLGRKVALITGVPLALFSLASLLFFTEWSRERFLADARRIGEEGEAEMRAGTEEILDTSNTVIRGTVDKITEVNRQDLAEIPFQLWGVDETVERSIKEEIRRHGEGLRDRSLANADALHREFRTRSRDRVENRVKAMRQRQDRAAHLFSRRLQGHTIAFLAASILLLVIVLWAGLWFTVLRPLRRIRLGTERLRTGDLSYRIEATSGDELGGLAASINSMSAELETSHRELAAKQSALEAANTEIRQWNRTLEERVREKTAQLESSLDQLKRTQAELVHAAKMAGLGTLAGGVAHEFNNLLGGIRGCAEEALEEDDPASVREALEMILKTSTRACTVVENLLRFSRKTPARLGRVRPAEMARDTLRLLEAEFDRKEIDLSADIDDAAAVQGDPTQLHQVYLNLLTNALHAVADNPVRKIGLRVFAEGGEVVSEIADSGEGIPPEIQDRLFEPFFTTKDGSGPSQRVGTGLGLSVTYGIVEAHHGRIETGTSAWGGALFRVRIPGEA